MALTASALGAGAGQVSALEAWQVSAGYQELIDALGGNVPTGVGVEMSQVEAPEGTTQQINSGQGRYFPVRTTDEFLGQPGGNIQFFDGSGFEANGVSGHATDSVGRWMYGNNKSVARGVSNVTVYDANRWLDKQLHVETEIFPESASYTEVAPDPLPGTVHSFKVQNHSWVYSSGSSSYHRSALLRYDYMIETSDLTAVVGANNNPLGAGIPNTLFAHPSLFAHSYNSIVVGRTSSSHSRGKTSSVYGPDRYRPDIVSNFTSTSGATAEVSGVAAVVRGVVAGTDADRSETTKAILLAGATKSEFAGFVEPSTITVQNPLGTPKPWDQENFLPNTGRTRPLDEIFGAGEVNIFNSYLITQGGQHAGTLGGALGDISPASAAGSYGWDYQDRKSDSSVQNVYYNFVIPEGSHATELSIMLAWNVKVKDTILGDTTTHPTSGAIVPKFTPDEDLQDLNLKFYDSTASFRGIELRKSDSDVDNVEHIYFESGLGPGTYTLEVSGSQSWDYGLAWRMSTLFDQVNADFDDNGIVDGADFLAWQRNQGKLVNATHADGDANGDGDVDAADLASYNAGTMPLPAQQALRFAASIPEPTTGALAALAFAAAGLASRCRLRSAG